MLINYNKPTLVDTANDTDDVQRTDERTARVQLGLRPLGDERLTFDLMWLHDTSDSRRSRWIASAARSAGSFSPC